MLIDFVKSEEINYLEEIMKFASGLQLNLNKNIFFFLFHFIYYITVGENIIATIKKRKK